MSEDFPLRGRVAMSEIDNLYPPLAEVSRSDGGGILIVTNETYGKIKKTSTPCPRLT